MKLLIIVFLVSFVSQVHGQNYKFKLLSHIDGAFSGGDDWGYGVTYDHEKSIYTVGDFAGTADFDPGPGVFNMTAGSSEDLFIQKIDSLGNFEWARQFGSTFSVDSGRDVCISSDSCLLIIGRCNNISDIDPGPSVVSGSQAEGKIVLIKLASDGSVLWVKNFGGASSDTGLKVATDQLGNIYMAGIAYSDSIDFNPGTPNVYMSKEGNFDGWVAKFNSNGDYVWSRMIGGSGSDYVRGLYVSDYVYVSGQFESNVDFDPLGGGNIIGSNGSSDAFIQKMDTLGNVIWTKTFGGIDFDVAYDICETVSHDVVAVGTFKGLVDFNPGILDSLVGSTHRDPYVLKLDSLGQFKWVNTVYSSSSAEKFYAVCTDTSGNIFVTGGYTGTCAFDTPIGYNLIQPTGAYENVVYAKLDSLGKYGWAKSIASSTVSPDLGMDIEINLNGELYLTGTFWAYADFDPGPDTVLNQTSANAGDVFTLVLDQCSCQDSLTVITSCNSFYWVNDVTYLSDTISYFIVSSTNGCDSIIILDLTINSVNTSITVINDITLESDATIAMYQWLDCNDNFSAIFGANSQSFTPIENGNYALQITENGCIDTSACQLVNSIGLKELFNSKKDLVKVVDLLGRESPDIPNTTLIYIYSDGTTEKIYRMK